MTTLFNNKFLSIFIAPFLLGAITILGFAPYNLTFINFFSFSFLLFLILEVKKRTRSKYIKVKLYGAKPSTVTAPSKKGAKNITKNLLLSKAIK